MSGGRRGDLRPRADPPWSWLPNAGGSSLDMLGASGGRLAKTVGDRPRTPPTPALRPSRRRRLPASLQLSQARRAVTRSPRLSSPVLSGSSPEQRWSRRFAVTALRCEQNSTQAWSTHATGPLLATAFSIGRLPTRAIASATRESPAIAGAHDWFPTRAIVPARPTGRSRCDSTHSSAAPGAGRSQCTKSSRAQADRSADGPERPLRPLLMAPPRRTTGTISEHSHVFRNWRLLGLSPPFVEP